MRTGTQQGFLILADITGFTPFVAHTELEHSNEILRQILNNIVSLLTPTFTLAEVEGDAVFVYAPLERFPRRERILEIIESSYAEFRDTKSSYVRMRTCNCLACQMAPTLDLKFVVHFGEYILNDLGGKKKPLGTSVNTAHRLLKNGIREATGWRAYTLFTRESLDAIGLDATTFHQQMERIEHIGPVETFSVDLDGQYRLALEDRRVYLAKEEADIVVERDFNVPPAVLWEWANDPKKRTQWNVGSDWIKGQRPSGRVRKGATNHCVKSKVIEMIQDYRPYHYYTSRMGRGFVNATLTCEFWEIPSGTRLSWRIKMHGILPRRISGYLCRLIVEKGLRIHQAFDKLAELVQQEEPAAALV